MTKFESDEEYMGGFIDNEFPGPILVKNETKGLICKDSDTAPRIQEKNRKAICIKLTIIDSMGKNTH